MNDVLREKGYLPPADETPTTSLHPEGTDEREMDTEKAYARYRRSRPTDSTPMPVVKSRRAAIIGNSATSSPVA